MCLVKCALVSKVLPHSEHEGLVGVFCVVTSSVMETSSIEPSSAWFASHTYEAVSLLDSSSLMLKEKKSMRRL